MSKLQPTPQELQKSGYVRVGSRAIAPTLFLFALNCILALYIYESEPVAWSTSLIALILLAFTAALILRNILKSWHGGFRLDIGDPFSIYSFLFLLYYVVVCYLYIFSSFNDRGNSSRIAALILFGYLAFWLGIRSTRVGVDKDRISTKLAARESNALLALCYFGAAMVGIHYVWLAAQGAYYTHAVYYQQPTTLEGALWNVFAGSFECPLVLLLGFLSQLGAPGVAGHARKFFWAYLIGILCIYITSSQFRPALTVMVFTLFGIRGGGGVVLKFRHILGIAALGMTGLLVIVAARVIVPQEEIAGADNQIQRSVAGAFSSLLPALKESRSEVYDFVVYRATLPVQFLSDIVDAKNSGRPNTYGALTMWTIGGLAPRLFWPDKPAVVPSQFRIEQYLNLPEFDNSAGPINYFYTEFGWLGVFVGFFCFGLLLGVWTKFTITSNSVFAWLVLFWCWSGFADVETDLVLDLLVAVRQVIVVYVLYRLIMLVVFSTHQQHRTLSVPKLAS
jgi:hypothetical protein